MNRTELMNTLNKFKNGAFIKVQYKGDLASKVSAKAKKEGTTVTKESIVTLRKGIDYDSQKSVKEKVENEGKVLTHELPWGTWIKGYEGLLIEHNGKTYLRVYMGLSLGTKYFINGVEKDFETLKTMGVMQPSFFKPKEKANAYTINIDNIMSVLSTK